MNPTATVLLVEDEREAREALARALEREGYTCLLAESPEEALAQARRAPFIDLVVTDIVLGSRDRGGLELIGELRAAGVHAPVIVATAFADVAKVKIALNLGAAYFIEKPFRAAELLAESRRLLTTPRDPTYAIDRGLAKVGLTPKEYAIARLLLKGLTSAEIARLEGNSDKTIRQHVTHIYAKCGVASRAELFHYLFPS